MSRRATRRATASRTRRRAAGLGVAVPAVVGVGALPAFATHSGGDEGIDEDIDLFSEEEPDEFGEARLLDADDDLNDGDLENGEMVEDGYDPFEKDDEEGAEDEQDSEESATEEDEQDEASEDESDDEEDDEADDEERNRGRERAEEASDGRSSAADDAPGRP